MATARITELPVLVDALASTDLLEIVDVSDVSISATGASKSATAGQLAQLLNGKLRTAARAASAVPLTKNSALVAGATLQGLTLANTNRILLGNQLDPGENGLWVVQAAGPPLRASDMAAGSTASATLIPVLEGSWAGALWICTALTGFDVVGTDALTFQSANQPPFSDATALLFADADPTKKVRVSLSALATGVTRVLSMPNYDVDLGVLAERGVDGEFAASNITNDSTVAGDSVQEALDTLQSVLDGSAGTTPGLDGLVYSKPVGTNYSLKVETGSVYLSSGHLLELSSAMTKVINGPWAAGSSSGGMDTGAVSPSTWYYVWLIFNPTTSITDFLFSLSATAPTMPSGYTVGYRLGAVLTNGSSNILAFQRWHDWTFWQDVLQDVSYTSAGSTGVSKTLRVPPAYVVEARMAVVVGGDINGRVVISDPDLGDVAPSTSRTTVMSGSAAECQMLTATAGAIRVRASGTGVAIRISTIGWRDGDPVWF